MGHQVSATDRFRPGQRGGPRLPGRRRGDPEDQGNREHRARPGRSAGRVRTSLAVAVALLAAAGLVLLTVRVLSAAPRRPCQASFVPAFFPPQGGWDQAISSSPAPGVMILDISGSGAGSAPEPAFQSVVARARAAGISVLGYSDTAYAGRPAAAVEADVRHYRSWYGVTSIFLDQAAGGPAQFSYYQGLSRFIRREDPGGRIWLNPGLYPDKRYLSVANVLMVFEGSYAAYRNISVPAWAIQYPADRFAHTVYAAPATRLSAVISLSRQRHAGYVYVTDGSGPNPYGALPSYWRAELHLVAARC